MALTPELVASSFGKLPVSVSTRDANELVIDLSGLRSLHWKGKLCDPRKMAEKCLALASGIWDGDRWIVRSELSGKQAAQVLRCVEDLANHLYSDNLDSELLWGKPALLFPTGFEEATENHSKALLQSLYADQFISAEKKSFVVDLERSISTYFISAGPSPHSFIDAAAQIATLAQGLNAPAFAPMAMRAELLDPDFKPEHWDIEQAYRKLLKDVTGLPYVAFVGSGSEAIETALRACQTKYQDRRRVIAFEGSFHGRTWLSLHATHSPSKRLPFQTFEDAIEFMPFPENLDSNNEPGDPDGWLQAWQGNWDLAKRFLESNDALLKSETETLLKIRTSALSDLPLAVLIEPMQCEGGDRYATGRFYRGLRVLTRTLGIPLIFDEVQTGFGLGSTFFWYQLFNLVDVNGKPDRPDCVCAAKKAQVGVCMSVFDPGVITETSPASIFRGLINAQAAQSTDSTGIANCVKLLLESLTDAIGSNTFKNPRNKGLCFAFDLPTPELLDQLVKRRFPNGLMFYPAGDRTARYRLTFDTTERELMHIFQGIYGCFQDLAHSGAIAPIKSEDTWLGGLPSSLKIHQRPKEIRLEYRSVFSTLDLPRDRATFLATSKDDWSRIFLKLAKNYPHLAFTPISLSLPLEQLNRLTASMLWDRYESDPDFTAIDLYWLASRVLSHRVEKWDEPKARSRISDILKLERTLYEPARQDDPDMLCRMAGLSNFGFLAAVAPNNDLAGICVSGPHTEFSHLPLVGLNQLQRESQVYYSVDLSIAPPYQSLGLGTRLKIEQLIAAKQAGIYSIKSRNRMPEAQAMIQLNRNVSAVTIASNERDYEGLATALYQSVELFPSRAPYHFWHQIYASLKNKLTLSNFVTERYVANLRYLKEFLPPDYRHIYLTSGRAEGVDKLVKLLRNKRPKARLALSFEGDYFGSTTACARSLGGSPTEPLRYFPWPVLKQGADPETALAGFDSELCLGIFIEPVSERTGEHKDRNWLLNVFKSAKTRGIPVLFHETASSFNRFDPSRFFCASDEFPADGLFLYCGGQLGLVAVREPLFLSQPLMMISTWDGDEHSLNLFVRRLVEHDAKT